MYYVTVKQSPMYHQMSLEEFLFGEKPKVKQTVNLNTANTRTYEVEKLSDTFLRMANIDRLVRKLKEFNDSTEDLRKVPRNQLYYTFYIPKKSGGLRKIDAPERELMEALRQLKGMFETEFKALYHTTAFAYVRNRSTLDAVKRHQENESRWFAKYDLHNFFGSTTIEFVMHMFSMVFPFSEVIKREDGKAELKKALELAFLDGVLPQGTPISPLITNIMMIPIDFKLTKGFRNMKPDGEHVQNFVNTRYADDFLISSRYMFDFRAVEKFIIDTLAEFGAPFTINRGKTHYGSSSGRNYNLGVCLNSSNEITVGYKAKKRFQAMLFSYVKDKQNGHPWDKKDIQVLQGYMNYYRMVEKDTINAMINHVGEKLGVNIPKMIKQDLS